MLSGRFQPNIVSYKNFLLRLCKAHKIGNVIEVEAAMIENITNQIRLLTLY
jgi:hypothetical protein